MSETLQLRVTGMTCAGCEGAIRQALGQLEGVEDVSASHTEHLVGVIYDAARVTPAAIRERIESLGYDVAAV